MRRSSNKTFQALIAAALVLSFITGCSIPTGTVPAVTQTAGPSGLTQTASPVPTGTRAPLGLTTPLAIFTPTQDKAGTPEATEAGTEPAGTATKSAATPLASATQPKTATGTVSAATTTATQVPAVRFAVIGDYGGYNASQTALADMINSWTPDFIVTTGDNNYPSGAASTIDENIGKNFHQYIGDYKGSFGDGSTKNKFFPVMGNHDWISNDGRPYLDYFTLPGNERYYSFTWGPMEFFMLDSDSHEPDGVSSSSIQAEWLKNALANSKAAWKVVVMHHAPYSSGENHGSSDWMQWPFEDWGADAVLAGHEHDYERLQIGNIPYFVNGLGGFAIYGFGTPLPESKVRYNDKYGAMLVEASSQQIVYQFFSIDGELIDTFTVTK